MKRQLSVMASCAAITLVLCGCGGARIQTELSEVVTVLVPVAADEVARRAAGDPNSKRFLEQRGLFALRPFIRQEWTDLIDVPMRVGQTVRLHVFDDTIFIVVIDEFRAGPDGVITFSGPIADTEFGEAALTIDPPRRAVFGTIDTESHVFVVEPVAGVGQRVTKVDPESRPAEADPAVSVSTGEGSVSSAAGDLKLLLVFGKENLEFCKDNRTALSQAFGNRVTKVFGRAGVSKSVEVALFCSNHSASGDLLMDRTWVSQDITVAQKRDDEDADLVSFMVDDGADCGLGFYNFPVEPGHKASAFSAVVYDCALTKRSLEHEIGHNLGMQHDRYSFKGLDKSDLCNYGSFLFQGDLPFRRTVMSRGEFCEDLNVTCPRTPRPEYSNPDAVRTSGVPCNATGGANNAEQLRRAVITASKFFP